MKAFRLLAVALPLLLLSLFACSAAEGPPQDTTPLAQVCTITLDAGMGTLQGDTLVAVSGTTLTLPTPTHTDSRYIFAGWSQNGSAPVRSITVEANATLRAVWTLVSETDFSYTEGAEGLTLVAYHGTAERVQIPSHIGEKTVVALGEGLFATRTTLTAVTIPDTVRVLGAEVFAGCTSLTEVTLPAGLTTLPDRAFFGCTALAQIALPNTLTACGSACFAGCTSLIGLTLPAGVTTLGDHAFASCTSLITLDLGARLTCLPNSMALGCVQLAELDLPASLITIEAYALSRTDIRVLRLPAGVTSIGDYAFADCDLLTSVTLASVTNFLGNGAFSGCDQLATIDIANAPLTTIGARAFAACPALKALSLPITLTALGEQAFAGCTGLCELTLPFVGAHPLDSRTLGYLFDHKADPLCAEITDSAEPFSLPRSLTTIHIIGTRLPAGAFAGCYTLQTITLAEGLQVLPNSTFDGCGSLVAITLPQTLTTIGDRAFADCVSLAQITLPAQLSALAENAFTGCVRMTTLYADCAMIAAKIGELPLHAQVLVLYLSEKLAVDTPNGYTRATVQDTLLYTKFIKTLGE